MRRRVIRDLARAALEELPTKTLLARLQSLRECEPSAGLSDRTAEEIAAAAGILFKDTPEWHRAYDDVKAVLATREHVPRRTERQAQRLARARTGTARTREKS